MGEGEQNRYKLVNWGRTGQISEKRMKAEKSKASRSETNNTSYSYANNNLE